MVAMAACYSLLRRRGRPDLEDLVCLLDAAFRMFAKGMEIKR